MISKLTKQLTLIVLGAASLALVAGCGSRAEDVCEETCAKSEECGATSCSCDAEKSGDCSNEDEILDHFESCNSKACQEWLGCLATTPACSS